MSRSLRLSVAVLALCLCAPSAAAAHDHSLGVGYRYAHLNTASDQVFDFHSPTIQYAMSVGTWLRFFANLELVIPLVGIQRGVSFSLQDTYDSKLGGDVSLGALLHFEPLDWLAVQTGLGPHMNVLTLSHPDLVTFESLTLGVTSYSTARYAISDVVETGLNLVVSVDFGDPIHKAENLDWGVHMAITALIGVRLGETESPEERQ